MPEFSKYVMHSSKLYLHDHKRNVSSLNVSIKKFSCGFWTYISLIVVKIITRTQIRYYCKFSLLPEFTITSY